MKPSFSAWPRQTRSKLPWNLLANLIDIEIEAPGRLHFEILDRDRRVAQVHFIRMLGEDFQPHVLEHRQHFGQCDRLATTEQLEAQVVVATTRAVQRHAHIVGILQARRGLDIARRNMRGNFLDIARRKCLAIAIGETRAFIVTVLAHKNLTQLVVPVAHDLANLRLELGHVVLRLVARLGANDHMHACERRLADLNRRIQTLAMKRALQQRLDAFAHVGVEPVAGHEYEAREKPPVFVGTHEQARTCATLQLQDAVCRVEQFIVAGLEQFFARQGFENIAQGLARMRIAAQTGALHHGFVLLPHQRNIPGPTRVCARGEEPEETMLDLRLAGVVKFEHADVIHVRGAMHGRARIGLGHDDRIGLAGLTQLVRDEAFQRARRARAIGPAQDAEARLRRSFEHFVAVLPGDVIFAIAEESEMVLGNPTQELLLFRYAFGLER